MTDELREVIMKNFPHIKFSSEDEMREWFFNTLLPFIILQWMGGIKTLEDGRGEFDHKNFDAIKEELRRWNGEVAKG